MDEIVRHFSVAEWSIRQSRSGMMLVQFRESPVCTFNADGIGSLVSSASVMSWSSPSSLTSVGHRYIPLGSPDLFQTVTGTMIVERSTYTTVASLPMSGGNNILFYNLKQNSLVIYHLRDRRYRRHEIVLLDKKAWEHMIL